MENYIKEFYLFSSSHKLAQKLYYLGDLKAIYLEKKHLNREIFNFAKLRNIAIYTIENADHLMELLPSETNHALAISYGIGFIFKKEHMEIFEYGIWNIHPGKLPDNRGRHPISWSFIKNDKYFTVSVHKINEKIDQGELIYECDIERDVNDDANSISRKIDNLLEGNLIENALLNFKNGFTTSITKGNYNPNLMGKFKEINPHNYTGRELFSIFKSQIIYGSLTINGHLYDNCDFFHEDFDCSESDVVECSDGELMILRKS